ncbi:MAG: hypothetical protein AB1714_05435 [Acidobacteriota bacterium]
MPELDAHDEGAGREQPEPNWRLLYAVVLGELLALILLFYAFTRIFS